ncbi:MAG TPA: phosphotransferase [Planctomycetota bacterium]
MSVRFRADSRPVADHPAWQAWTATGLAGPVPAGIDALADERGRRPNRKSAVYRIPGADPCGGDLIAKRTAADAAAVEYAVYTRILPALGLEGLRCHGLQDAGGELAWMFLQEAVGEPFDVGSAPHRRAAGTWLGRLHAGASRGAAARALPDHGPLRYAPCIPESRESLAAALDNPRLDAAARRQVAAWQQLLERVETNWSRLTDIAAAPRTLVHGDFVRKNVRLRRGPAGWAVLAFDWDICGWGPPGIDLEYADLDAWREETRQEWPLLNGAALEVQCAAGSALRNLGLLHADAPGLAGEWPEASLLALDACTAPLAAAVARLEAA